MDTFDVSPVPAFENDTLPAPPDVIHVPAVAAGAKRKGRPAKVSPPSMSLFAAATSGGRYWLGVDRDDDDGIAVRLFTGDVLLSVDYSGPSDRTLVSELKGKRGCYIEPLNTGEVAGFERFGIITAVTLDASTVSSALDYLMPAMSPDLTRCNLTAVFFDINGKWVATDGYRLHLVTGMQSPFSKGAIIPAAAIRALSKAIKATKTTQVGVEGCGDLVTFIVHGEHLSVRITSRLMDGRFPDYTQVLLDTSAAHAFTVDAKEARSVIASAPVIGDRMTGRDFSFNDEGVTTYRHDKRPSRIPCQYLAGCNVDVRLNAKYVDQALSECDGATTFYVGADDLTPVMMTNGQRLSVVMPLRK